MNYIGIDIHKKCCVLSALNEAGERTIEARIATNDRAGFEEYLRALGGSNGTTARLGSALTRPQAEWLWSHADAGNPTIGIAMMKLGSGNRLTLCDPVDATKAAIVLNPNPAIGSRINGPVRIPPAGDLDMGSFTNGPKPDDSN